MGRWTKKRPFSETAFFRAVLEIHSKVARAWTEGAFDLNACAARPSEALHREMRTHVVALHVPT
jgi:hypothetical protein